MRRAISFVWKRPSSLVERRDGRDQLDAMQPREIPGAARSPRSCCPTRRPSPSPGARSSLAISASAGATMPCSPLRVDAGTTTTRLRSSADRSASDEASRGTTGGGSRCARSPRRGRAAASARPWSGTRRAAARPPAGRAGRGSRARPRRSAPPHRAQMCWTNAQPRRTVVPEPRSEPQARKTRCHSRTRPAHHRPDHGRAPRHAADQDVRRPLRRHRRRSRPAARRHARRRSGSRALRRSSERSRRISSTRSGATPARCCSTPTCRCPTSSTATCSRVTWGCSCGSRRTATRSRTGCAGPG